MSVAQSHRIRGESFKQDYQGGARRRVHRRRDPSMNRSEGIFVLPAQEPQFEGKIVLVLDLDETLVFARRGPLYGRPGLSELFSFCKEYGIEVVVWTAGLKSYAQAIVENIDTCHAVTHCVYRHNKWFTGRTGYRKDLAALGRSLDRVLIIENTPDCIRGYQDNGILVPDYHGMIENDDTLYMLIELLRGLVESNMSVPQFITSSQMLRKMAVQTDLGDCIHVYSFATHYFNQWNSRVNMDLAR